MKYFKNVFNIDAKYSRMILNLDMNAELKLVSLKLIIF